MVHISGSVPLLLVTKKFTYVMSSKPEITLLFFLKHTVPNSSSNVYIYPFKKIYMTTQLILSDYINNSSLIPLDNRQISHSEVPRSIGKIRSSVSCKRVLKWGPNLSPQGWCFIGMEPLQRRPLLLVGGPGSCSILGFPALVGKADVTGKRWSFK